MWIVISGNPIGGLAFHGLFNTAEEALEWAEQEFKLEDWWIEELATMVETVQ